jgi:hypothetical protein
MPPTAILVTDVGYGLRVLTDPYEFAAELLPLNSGIAASRHSVVYDRWFK